MKRALLFFGAFAVGLAAALLAAGLMLLPSWLQTRALQSQRPSAITAAQAVPDAPSPGDVPAPPVPTPLPAKDFTDLLARNPEVVGWIAIDGTPVDFPVLQGRDNEYYLHHDLDRQYDPEGIPYADYECDLQTGRHLILYGHNMGVGQTARFSSLQNYRHPDYYTRHPVIALDTLYGSALYKVAVCCLPTSAFAVTDKVSPKIHVTYMLDGKSEKTQEFWPGEVTYHAGQKVKYSWDKLYEKMELPADTRVKDKKTGACELDLSYKADSVFHGYLTVELEPHFWMDFTIRYVGPDGAELESRAVHMQYSPSTAPDAWDLITGSAAFLNYKAELKELKIQPGDDKDYTGKDQLKINPELKDKTLVAYLGQSQNLEAQTVEFQLRYLSTDNQIQDTQPATLTYGPDDERTDAWDFIQAQDAYKTYATQGYALANYVVPADGGDRLCDRYGMQAVTTELQGKTVIVHLVKAAEKKTETVDFTLRFLSDDGKVDLKKQASVTYDPNGKGVDGWKYLTGTFTLRGYEKEGYRLQDFRVPQPAGETAYTDAGQFTVTPALASKTVTVRLAAPARYESSYLIHFVDENGKEFLPTATAKVNWTEGQQLNLMAQLKDTLAAVSAKGYTFRTLTVWNGTAAYKGTELVVPGSWELAAHCTKNPTPAGRPAGKHAANNPAPAKAAAKAAPAKPAAAPAKPAAAPAKPVVKPAAPAANNTKILLKTGVQVQTPVVFSVMLIAALAGAAIYLFALRKKLN